MPSPIHAAAQAGYTQAADTYARGRPTYPQALHPWLTDTLGLRAGRTVVDLGAGTGKFTQLLASTGANVVAVEPVAAMRDTLARSSAGWPQPPQILAGTAEAIPLPDASVDAVVCAQAFHWFATPAALREIARVLTPDGVLGLVWNVRDTRVDWVAALEQLLLPLEGDAPRHRTGAWRAAFTGSPFTLPAPEEWTHSHVGSVADVVIARQLSVSFVAALPAERRAELEQALHALVARYPALQGQAQVAFPYVTQAYACRRVASGN